MGDINRELCDLGELGTMQVGKDNMAKDVNPPCVEYRTYIGTKLCLNYQVPQQALPPPNKPSTTTTRQKIWRY